MTGERKAGRMPVATEFCMVVTSLVRRVTREELLKWSVLAKENCCSFAIPPCGSQRPRLGRTGREHGGTLSKTRDIRAKSTICSPFIRI